VTNYFDITTAVTEIALSDELKGELTFTVSNATTASIRGESVVIPGQGATVEWFTVDRPVRTYQRGQADQVGVAVAVPKGTPAGTYSFQLRTLLGGGVPEEDYDDSPSVSFKVPEPPKEPPPKKPFPWWILLVIAAIVIAIIVIGGIVFVVTRPGPSPSPSPSPTPTPTPTPEPLPDLVVARVLEQPIGVVLVDIRNLGNGPAGPFDVLAIEEDPIGADDVERIRVREGLDPGAFRQLQFTTLGDTFGGQLEVTVRVDSSNEIEESNEGNNVRSNVR
jgi:hypothetical protein